jgi:penicillin-insensitive murein endopeptidase
LAGFAEAWFSSSVRFPLRSLRSSAPLLACAAVVLAGPVDATAAPRRTAHLETEHLSLPRAIPGGLSVGSPTSGHLVGGVRLEDEPWLRIVPCYEAGDVRWGLEALVSLVERGGRAVRKEFPDSVLSIGHLSRRSGGDLDRHASHESGRDADVGFYIVNERGRPIYADHFVRFLGDGTAPSWPGARFDDARNWAFLAAIVTGDGAFAPPGAGTPRSGGEADSERGPRSTPGARARVSHVFVATPLRERLLAYAQRIGAPYAVRVRASEVMAQPRGALPHDDHFHVRISCPSGMDACVEQPTPNLARSRLLHPRQRGAETVAVHVHAPRSAPPAPASPPRLVASLGSPASDLPALPAPSPAPAAVFEAPIDDVDGPEE